MGMCQTHHLTYIPLSPLMFRMSNIAVCLAGGASAPCSCPRAQDTFIQAGITLFDTEGRPNMCPVPNCGHPILQHRTIAEHQMIITQQSLASQLAAVVDKQDAMAGKQDAMADKQDAMAAQIGPYITCLCSYILASTFVNTHIGYTFLLVCDHSSSRPCSSFPFSVVE